MTDTEEMNKVINDLQNIKTRSKKQQKSIDVGCEAIKTMMEQLQTSPEDKFKHYRTIYHNNMKAMEKINDEMEAELKELKEENKKLLSPMECGGQLEKDLDELKEWRKLGKTEFSDLENVDEVSLMIDDMYENIKELKAEVKEWDDVFCSTHDQQEEYNKVGIKQYIKDLKEGYDDLKEYYMNK